MKHKKICSDPRIHLELVLATMGLGVMAVMASYVDGGTWLFAASLVCLLALIVVLTIGILHVKREHS